MFHEKNLRLKIFKIGQIKAIFLVLMLLQISPIVNAQFTDMKKILTQATDNYDKLEILYKKLHQNPELSGQEKYTSELIKAELASYGYEVRDKIGGYGVVGILRNGNGPTVMLRTDMDALPIEEKTGLPYASKMRMKDKNGRDVSVMHACGHDLHITNFLGTAQALINLKSEWHGTLILVAQPAEENGTGAKAMLDAGLFTKFPKPDYVLAMHASAELEAGKIGIVSGYVFAGADNIDVTVFGVGGHGAFPHKTIDPIILASELVLSLQTLISREINATIPAVITVGAFNGGTENNIIPSEVNLKITMRTYSAETRTYLLKRIGEIANGLAAAKGLPKDKYPKIVVAENPIPSVYNDPELMDKISKSIINSIGKINVTEVSPIMASEDFARYANDTPAIPIAIIWLGSVPTEVLIKNKDNANNIPSLHSPFYYPDMPNSIKTGVRSMTAAVMGLMK